MVPPSNMMKPKEIAIAKCAAHRTNQSRISLGYKAADDAAKVVTEANRPDKVLLVTHEVDLEEVLRYKMLLPCKRTPIPKINSFGKFVVPHKTHLAF